MVYLSQFEHDVFVSYAHLDNQKDRKGADGWTSSLVNALRVKLSEILGSGEVDVWMDQRMRGNDPLDEGIMEEVRDSATLLVIKSPSYTESHWCRFEFEVFLAEASHKISDSRRIFVVERLPIAAEKVPAGLQNLAGYRFYQHDEHASPRPLSIDEPVFNPKLYGTHLAKVATDLAEKLTQLKSMPVVEPPKIGDSLRPDRRAAETEQRHSGPPGLVSRGGAESAATVAASARRIEPLPPEERAPEASLGFFVGIGDFDQRSYLPRLPYAPDDAVALAYLFVQELKLIAPERTLLALGGVPASVRARKWLESLKGAGVNVLPATRTELLYAIETLATKAYDRNALVTASFSTHGYVEDGCAFLMPSDGARRFTHETGIKLDRIYDACERIDASSKLLLVDACRASMSASVRGGENMTDELAAALQRAQSGVALLSSCGPGQMSWESHQLGQGVFTYFFVEGLCGEAPGRPEDGTIALDSAFLYALARTNQYVRTNINAEQLPWFGGEEVVKSMPLAVSVAARREAEAQIRQRVHLVANKEKALRCLIEARLAHRDMLPLTLQQQVEQELDILDGERLDDLIEMMMALEDRSRRTCRMFVAWWDKEHSVSPNPGELLPVPNAPWSNSLGMTFMPVGDILIAVWPTRLQDFRAFVVESGYRATAGHFHSWTDGSWRVQGHNWMNPGFKQTPTHPVVGIMWQEGIRFCDWLTERERRAGVLSTRERYRLPTDAEWTMAVGNGSYPWGDTWPPPENAGNYRVTRPGDLGTTAAGSYPPNALGLHDLGGNVWEWCDGYYLKEMTPPELREQFDFLNDDGGGTYRFLRGGSWFNAEQRELLSAYRNPGKFPDARFSNVGFRCVLGFDRTKPR
jgi:hypothetical protein